MKEIQTKIISFSGMERCDIPYYAARIFNSIGKKVLILDNSKTHGIFNSLPKVKGESVINMGNMFVLCDRAYDERFFEYMEADVVIVYHGKNPNDDLLNKSDASYLILNYDPFEISDIKKSLDKMQEHTFQLLFLDKVSSKISEKQIIEDIGLLPEYIDDNFQVMFNEGDYMCYLNLVRNGSQHIKSLSVEMKDFFKTIIPSAYPEMDKKTAEKQFRKALSGKLR